MSFQGTRINPRNFDRSQLKFYLVLVPLSLFMVLPILYIINQAFKPMDELFRFPPTFLVREPTLMSFRRIWFIAENSGVPMVRYIINSLVITLVTVVVSVVLTAMTAYVLSKKKFRAKKWLLTINQWALMFVPTAVLVPRYLVIVALGLNDNFWAHILPGLAVPVGLFLVKQFVDQVPDTLIEAARLDGAGEFSVMTRIVFPLIKPAMATVGILVFQEVWNAVDPSNYYIVDETLKNFAFYLRSFSIGGNSMMVGIAAAASLILFLPNLIIFIAMQSRVMSTMSHSGIK